MKIRSIIEFFGGFYHFQIAPEDVAALGTALLQSGIRQEISPDGNLLVSLINRRRMENFLRKAQIPFSAGELRGLPGYLWRLRRRVGLLVALGIVLAAAVFSSSFVWDVRVEGNETIPAVAVEEALAGAGLHIGSRWRGIDTTATEARVLSGAPQIAWVHINRRGTVAYVRIAERQSPPAAPSRRGTANIVASEDAVIEEVRVRAGYAAVKAGETVRAGDLLVSGLLPDGSLVFADAEVRGRVEAEISVFVPRTDVRTETGTTRLSALTLNFFDFSVNLYKNYGNPPEGCVIIEDDKKLALPGGQALPFSFRRSYCLTPVYRNVTYTDAELTRLASLRLQQELRLYLADADLLQIRTTGAFTDDGYRMTAYVVSLRPVGVSRSIPAEP